MRQINWISCSLQVVFLLDNSYKISVPSFIHWHQTAGYFILTIKVFIWETKFFLLILAESFISVVICVLYVFAKDFAFVQMKRYAIVLNYIYIKHETNWKCIPVVKCSLLPVTAHLSSAHPTCTETQKWKRTLLLRHVFSHCAELAYVFEQGLS